MQLDGKVESRRSRPLAEAWGGWLEAYEWSHWATLTFRPHEPAALPGLAAPRPPAPRPGPPPDYAHRRFGRFLSDLSLKVGGGVGWFRGDEFGRRGGRLHFHALLAGTGSLLPETLAGAWRDGFALVEPYDAQLGAAHYVAKYVTKDFADYDVGGVWTRCDCGWRQGELWVPGSSPVGRKGGSGCIEPR